MSDINAAWVERWLMERLQTKARPDREGSITKATAWRDLASFRAVIAKAVKWGLLEQNPIQQLRMKAAKPRSVVRFLSPAEEQRLRGALTARDVDHAAARRSANEWRAARKRPLFPEVAEGTYADHLTPAVLVAMNTCLLYTSPSPRDS